jgi:hypothetical protein
MFGIFARRQVRQRNATTPDGEIRRSIHRIRGRQTAEKRFDRRGVDRLSLER